MKMKEICDQCVHKKDCARPCRPVELHLQAGNPCVYEKTYQDPLTGRMVTVIYPANRKEIRQSTAGVDEDANPAFAAEMPGPFRHFDPQLKMTGVFVDRFFRKLAYEDLAVKYGLTENAVAGVYRKSVERLFVILRYMDQRKSAQNAAARMKKLGDIPKSHQWFIMARVLNMTPTEISELEGINPKTGAVRKQIARVADQLAAGESGIIIFTPEQRREAKSRLEKRRAFDRRRMRRKNNQES